VRLETRLNALEKIRNASRKGGITVFIEGSPGPEDWSKATCTRLVHPGGAETTVFAFTAPRASHPGYKEAGVSLKSRLKTFGKRSGIESDADAFAAMGRRRNIVSMGRDLGTSHSSL
jgi:hypothetical protein